MDAQPRDPDLVSKRASGLGRTEGTETRKLVITGLDYQPRASALNPRGTREKLEYLSAEDRF